MKIIILFIFAISSLMSYGQQLDGYNCIFLNSHTNNQWGLDDRIKESFERKGFRVITSQSDISRDPQKRLATLELTYSFEIRYGGSPFNFKLTNMIGEKIFEAEGFGNTLSAKADANRACKRALGKMEKLTYTFDPSKTPKLPIPSSDKANWTEKQIINYLSRKDINIVEGIYKNIGGSFYKLAILADENKYVAIVIDTDQPNWYAGSLKAVIEHIRNKFYNICFYENNYSKTETISEIDDNGVLKIGEHSFIKVFPNNQ